MGWDNHARGYGPGEHWAMGGRVPWAGSEQDNTGIIQRRSVHRSNLLHRAGKALGEGGETGTEQV